MKKYLLNTILSCIILLLFDFQSNAQTCEWRLVNPIFNATDPDGAGPAKGSVTFTFQVHTVSGSIPNVTGLSCGWSFQSSLAMIPTTPGCATVNTPANVVISPGIFTTGAYAYNTVAQCNIFVQNIGGKSFDRTSAGTLEGSPITLTTTWANVYSITLWTLSAVSPEGGFVIINSGAGGTPNELGSYAISDLGFNEYIANSLTATTPLAIGGVLPVTYTSFTAGCTDKGALIKWTTGTELNADYFELQRSNKDGIEWSNVNKTKVKAKGNSTTETNYEQMDQLGGAALYRLKQYDLDGTFHYSNIIRTNCADRNIEIVIYPVPAKDVLNIVVRTDKAVKTQLEIYDASGRLVKKINTAIISGNNNIPVSLLGLANGQYIIRSTDPLLPLNKKFTIMH